MTIPPDMDAYGRVRCAILGATGLVAQRLFQRLQFHPWLEPVAIIGSHKTSGTPHDLCLWSLDEERSPESGLTIGGLEDVGKLIENFQELGVRIVFSALPDEPAAQVERPLASAGFIVVSHAQIHRLEDDVPLIVPEVNIEHLSVLANQTDHGNGRLIACSNCTVVPLAITLAPLLQLAPIAAIAISTEQALSGGGRKMLAAGRAGKQMPSDIPGEADSVRTELAKILETNVRIAAECKRVMRDHGHYARLEVVFAEPVSAHQVIMAWREFTTRSQELDLPSAPSRPIVFVDGELSQKHRWVGSEGVKHPGHNLKAAMSVAVGEVEVEGSSLRFSTFADNTIRGAAGYSVLLAEQLLADGLMHDNNTILSGEIDRTRQ